MPTIMDTIASALGQAFAGPGGGFTGALPGGALLGGGVGGIAANALTSLLGGGSQSTSTFGLPFIDVAPQGGAVVFEPFIQAGQGARAHHFIAVNPSSGRMQWFGPMGQPVLWSGDLRAARRVRKIAGRYRRRMGGR